MHTGQGAGGVSPVSRCVVLQEAPLSNTVLRSLRLTSPLLFTLGAAYAVAGQQRNDHSAVATALCLTVCAAGLFAEDLLQDGYRRDRVVLAYVAAHPGATARQAARALDTAEKVVGRCLSRLVEDGLIVLNDEAAAPDLPSYRLQG